jgi:hypothetical protein
MTTRAKSVNPQFLSQREEKKMEEEIWFSPPRSEPGFYFIPGEFPDYIDSSSWKKIEDPAGSLAYIFFKRMNRYFSSAYQIETKGPEFAFIFFKLNLFTANPFSADHPESTIQEFKRSCQRLVRDSISHSCSIFLTLADERFCYTTNYLSQDYFLDLIDLYIPELFRIYQRKLKGAKVVKELIDGSARVSN